MESTRENSDNTRIPPLPEGDKRTSSTNDSVDYDSLNDLLLHVRTTLCSDVLGNLTIKGSHTAKDSRHQHLQDVVKLTQLLEEVKALMERDVSAEFADFGMDGKRGGKFTSSQQAAIRNIVLQTQREQGSNPQSRYRLLEDQLAAAKTECDGLKSTNLSLMARVTFLERTVKGMSDVPQDVRSLRMDLSAQKRVQYSLEESIQQLSSRADRADQQLERLDMRIEQLEDGVGSSENETKADASDDQSGLPACRMAEEDDTAASLPERKEVAIICDGPRFKTGNQLGELSEQQIQRRKRHLDVVIQHARALASLLQEDQEINLPKQNKVSMEWEEQEGSVEAIAAAQQLWRVMKAGDCVRVERAEDCPRITYWFAQPIARARLEGDYGIPAA